MIRRPPRSTLSSSSAASDVYKRQVFCVASGRSRPYFLRMKARRNRVRPEGINADLARSKGPVSKFLARNYHHFNAAALMDAAKGYEAHLQQGGKMLVAMAGAMSTAELGIALAEMIRQDKVHAVSYTH